MVSGFAAIKMINSAGVALYLERCAVPLPQLAHSNTLKVSTSSGLCPPPFCINHIIVLCVLCALSAVKSVHS